MSNKYSVEASLKYLEGESTERNDTTVKDVIDCICELFMGFQQCSSSAEKARLSTTSPGTERWGDEGRSPRASVQCSKALNEVEHMMTGSAQPPQGATHDGISIPRGSALVAEQECIIERGAVSDPEEAALIERTIKGDKEAYQVIVEKYQRRLMACAFDILKSREDAEDIVQEAFVKSFFALKGFRGGSSLSTWFHRIVFNLSIDLKRKFRRRGGDPIEFDERTAPAAVDVGGVTVTPERSLEQQEVGAQIRKALEQLSDEHRQAIVLREVEGLSYEEIAEVVGISVGTVMSRLFYARKRLQSVLSDLR